MSTPLIIRPARFKDLLDIKKCNERNLPENYDINTWKTFLGGQIRNSYVLTNAADVIVGYIVCNGSDLLSFAIDDPYRHMGYGVLLLNRVIETCAQNEIPHIVLHVRCGNLNARTLYEKSGFVIQSTVPSYYLNPVEDALQMKLKLIK